MSLISPFFIKVKFKDVSERVVNVQKSLENSGQFLNIELLTRNTSVGEEMRARIDASEPMDLVHYVVIGRGDILVAKTFEVSAFILAFIVLLCKTRTKTMLFNFASISHNKQSN